MRICILAIMSLALLTGEAHARKAWFSGGYCQASYGYAAGYYAPGYYEVYTPPVVLNVAAFIPYLAYQPVGYSTYQPVVATPVIVPNQVAPVAQAIPIPQQQRAPAYDCKEHTAGLEKRLAFMEQLMLNMSKGSAPEQPSQPQVQPMPQNIPPPPPSGEPQPPQTGVPPGLAIAVAKCGKCHEKVECTKLVMVGDKQVQKGGGFAMLDGGKFITPTDASTTKYTKKLLSGKMPPEGEPKLTQQEMPLLMQMILDAK